MSTAEYAVFEREWDTAQPRLEEALDVIRMAWTEESVEWEGEHYRYHGLTVRPKPAQQPHPPIYVPANKDPDNFRMIGRHGYNLMTLPWITGNPEQRPRIEIYLESLRNAGYSEDDHDIFVMYPAYVGEDDRQARDEVEDAWHRWREFALEEIRMDPPGRPCWTRSTNACPTTPWCRTAGASSADPRPASSTSSSSGTWSAPPTSGSAFTSAA